MILVDKRELYNIDGMTPEMDDILEFILRNYSGVFSDYIFIDENTIAYKYHISPQKIYETLLFLSRKHIINYIPRKRTAYIYFPYSRTEPRHLEITKDIYETGKQSVVSEKSLVILVKNPLLTAITVMSVLKRRRQVLQIKNLPTPFFICCH